jgi:hypothetical protein
MVRKKIFNTFAADEHHHRNRIDDGSSRILISRADDADIRRASSLR